MPSFRPEAASSRCAFRTALFGRRARRAMRRLSSSASSHYTAHLDLLAPRSSRHLLKRTAAYYGSPTWYADKHDALRFSSGRWQLALHRCFGDPECCGWFFDCAAQVNFTNSDRIVIGATSGDPNETEEVQVHAQFSPHAVRAVAFVEFARIRLVHARGDHAGAHSGRFEVRPRQHPSSRGTSGVLSQSAARRS